MLPRPLEEVTVEMRQNAVIEVPMTATVRISVICSGRVTRGGR